MDRNIEEITADLNNAIKNLLNNANAISIYVSVTKFGVNRVNVHLDDITFKRISMGMITCIEKIGDDGAMYPFEESVFINGVRFFCLLNDIKETA